MDFALMVPVLLALPKALAHWPTTAAALVAGTVWVTVVEAPRVTVMAVGAGASSHAQSPATPLGVMPLTCVADPEHAR